MAQPSTALIEAKIKAARGLDKEMEQRLKAIFKLLDPFETDLTYPAFEAAFLAEMERVAGRHYVLERAFLEAYISREFGIKPQGTDAAFTALTTGQKEAAKSSLSSLTRSSIKAHTAKGHSITKAYTDAETRVLGLGKRVARDPSRELTAKASGRTRGLGYYKRVTTSGNTCSWCEMIAGRGAVYTIDTAQGSWHDNCSCLAVPARYQDGPKPTNTQKTMVKPKKTELDKEKIRENIKEWERKRDAGEIELTPLPPRPTFV